MSIKRIFETALCESILVVTWDNTYSLSEYSSDWQYELSTNDINDKRKQKSSACRVHFMCNPVTTDINSNKTDTFIFNYSNHHIEWLDRKIRLDKNEVH